MFDYITILLPLELFEYISTSSVKPIFRSVNTGNCPGGLKLLSFQWGLINICLIMFV